MVPVWQAAASAHGRRAHQRHGRRRQGRFSARDPHCVCRAPRCTSIINKSNLDSTLNFLLFFLILILIVLFEKQIFDQHQRAKQQCFVSTRDRLRIVEHEIGGVTAQTNVAARKHCFHLTDDVRFVRVHDVDGKDAVQTSWCAQILAAVAQRRLLRSHAEADKRKRNKKIISQFT